MIRLATALAALMFAVACGGNTGPSVRVTIPPGSTMRVAIDSLSRAGVIKWGDGFRVYASLRKSDRGIKAGTYMLRRNSSWNSVLEALRAGKGIVYIVLVPEGYSVSQIEPLLASRLNQPLDSVQAAVRDTALLHRLDIKSPTLEGYLFPDTYIFAAGTTPRTAVAAMVKRFEQVWKPEWTARLDTLRLSRNEIMALAAIVEKEARLAPERPVI
ncbi:MAG TPA: endolytic transglycosylase MltG, partial [Gemmatimonadaceae bacterium]